MKKSSQYLIQKTFEKVIGRFECKDENFALKWINQERVNTQLENLLTLICIKFEKLEHFAIRLFYYKLGFRSKICICSIRKM